MEFVEDDSNVQELERSPSAKDTHLCYDSLLNRECNQSSNLTSLCLSGSYALDLRNFRLMLPNIRELSVNCCKLKNLDGLSNFPYLQTLNASSNNINDLYPCMYLENINHIDLQRNEISDISNIEYLALCPKLESVTLLENPLCFDVKNDEIQASSTYCTKIANLIPNIKYLDGYDLSIVCQDFLTNANQPSHIHYRKDLSDNSSSLLGIEAFKEFISVPTRSSTDILESVNTSHAYSSFCESISQEYCFLPTPLHSSKCFTSTVLEDGWKILRLIRAKRQLDKYIVEALAKLSDLVVAANLLLWDKPYESRKFLRNISVARYKSKQCNRKNQEMKMRSSY